tara:strand:- start:244 stop:903 length:660 start_codon:yes stop_codon:yes gene_type:complete
VTRDRQIEIFKRLYDVSRETINQLLDYEKLILSYQKDFNLVGRGTLDQIWIRHFADSAKIFPIIKKNLDNYKNNPIKLIDIGTGAGLPGVVFSIISEVDGFKSRVFLVDSNQKKCRFLNKVKEKLGLSYQVVNERSEKLKEKFDVITCRAVSSVLDILNKNHSMIGLRAKILLFKGKNWEIELKESKKKWKFKCNVVKNNKLLDSTGGVTLELTNIKKI